MTSSERRDALVGLVGILITLSMMYFAVRRLGPDTVTYSPPLSEVQIVSPDVTIPAAVAAFSGEWSGRWSDGYETVLAVREIYSSDAAGHYKAHVLYAHGSMPRFEIYRPGIDEFEATIIGQELIIANHPFVMRYRILDDGLTLAGVHQRRVSGPRGAGRLEYAKGAFHRVGG